MSPIVDGPASSAFRPLEIGGTVALDALERAPVSETMGTAAAFAPSGDCVCWGMPFHIGQVHVLSAAPVDIPLPSLQTGWLVCMHTSDQRPQPRDAHGLVSPMRGSGQLNELAARYVVCYADGEEVTIEIRRRHQIGTYQRIWGENCFQAVAAHKPHPVHAHHEQAIGKSGWGWSQTRANAADDGDWVNWLYAWQNPYPQRTIVGLRLEPVSGSVIFSALTCGEASDTPLRWRPRRKALVELKEPLDNQLTPGGVLRQIQLDLGQVISAISQFEYPQETWSQSANNRPPLVNCYRAVIEYTAHVDAWLHLSDGRSLPVAQLEGGGIDGVRPVAPATVRVRLRTLDKASQKPVPVKLHAHGEAGEYLAPVDRHRFPNASWFEDYSVDFSHNYIHWCTYIPGETHIDLPVGKVHIEISKGFEIRPIRRVIEVRSDTQEIVIELEKVLPWRERGWVTADTHVHFLSPLSALLEGAAEGVNVVNLLASQWGELMTNVGDFDGRTTWGSKEAGGDGEHLVRVGTENRQHVMGHISLLGYRGPIIAPMTTGGPDESALGDPIEVLLTEWARQAHKQGGLVILPHFPNPRAEHAAAIVEGEIDGVEMTSWGDLYSGISPYSLSDWYRYLNCGYAVPAVGGTDKMSANTAVGTVRTYALLPSGMPFDYATWMEAVRSGRTFVTYGPLIDMTIEGRLPGERIPLPASGGTVNVEWQVASVTTPISRVELVVNGEIVESVAAGPEQARGNWSLHVTRSSWIALLVRGLNPGYPEIVAAHSSPVMVDVEGSAFFAAADAVTILEQIEGALAYLDTVGTRAEDRIYKRMRLVLEGAHRRLHNRMHQLGQFHEHTPPEDHAAHH